MIMMGIRIIPTVPNADHRSHGRAAGDRVHPHS